MIHRYHLDDWYIVIDTCSGSVHVVDDIAYEIIALFEEKSKEECEALSVKDFLKKQEKSYRKISYI